MFVWINIITIFIYFRSSSGFYKALCIYYFNAKSSCESNISFAGWFGFCLHVLYLAFEFKGFFFLNSVSQNFSLVRVMKDRLSVLLCFWLSASTFLHSVRAPTASRELLTRSTMAPDPTRVMKVSHRSRAAAEPVRVSNWILSHFFVMRRASFVLQSWSRSRPSPSSITWAEVRESFPSRREPLCCSTCEPLKTGGRAGITAWTGWFHISTLWCKTCEWKDNQDFRF